MSIEWIAVAVFFLLFWALTFAEAAWMSRAQWGSFASTLTFSATSNLLGFFIGSIVVFCIVLALFMLTFEPVPNAAANETIMWTGVILALVFPPLFLLLVKRLLLKFFKMDTGRPAWTFSALSSVLIVFTSVAIPCAFLYVALKIMS